MQSKVEICGVNTSRLKTLKQEEMTQLLAKAKAGDKEARDRLVEGNLRLVLSVTQRFMGRGENPDDLFQVGCIGLLKAVQNFDATKEVRFSTYGVPMIAGEIRRYLRDNSPIRVSRSVRDLAYRILQCKEQLLLELGREPTMEQVAEKMQLPLSEVVSAMDAVAVPISLYEPVYSDGGDPLTVMDQVRDTRNTDEKWMEQIALKEALHHLDERERQILALRFHEGRTQMEVAKQIGISQAQVSRLEKNALGTIREAIC
ncbi:MAG: RNA polymerase sporulation sigma factor SigG [Oscillospiraceae bacterium]|nr:RNA polymerase sporulation sigma factor SigG [Oscillospiraceae bacterium]